MEDAMKTDSIENRLSKSIIIIVILAICLAITTAALAYSIVSVEDNIFTLATMEIDLNGGEPIITENEFLLEPGMTVKKDFYVFNKSSFRVYYKLYFKGLDGGLADVLYVTICDGDDVLYEGNFDDIQKLPEADDILEAGEKKELQMYISLPKDAGNSAQNSFLSFDFAVDAVQFANNPDKKFN